MTKAKPLKMRLKKDIIVPAGTVLKDDGVVRIEYGSHHIMHCIAFGRNAVGDLRVGTEIGDREFDEWFEKID